MADDTAREERLRKFHEEYRALGHAIQTGVMYELELEHPGFSGTDIGRLVKHLRTGNNCRARDHAALARLLIRNGVISEEEYEQELLAQLREEKEAFERMLTEAYGGTTKVTLG